MGDFPHYVDIILFAMVAAFLVLRLRSVLGRRTGNERRRDVFVRQADARGDKVVALAQRNDGTPPRPTDSAAPGSVAAGITQIRRVDEEFEPSAFLQGARGAFEIIVSAFARGEKARLQPLLSEEVFSGFAAAIDERQAAGETLESRIEAIKSIDIVDASLSGPTARVTVKLTSDQINVLRARDGSVIDGDPQSTIEKTDFWTFIRDTRSSDPNWALAATGSA